LFELQVENILMQVWVDIWDWYFCD